MSRKANCYDNAVTENFFGHLKTEMYNGEAFGTVEELTQAIEDYIQWYDTERIQQRLKGLTPMHYRNQALEPPSRLELNQSNFWGLVHPGWRSFLMR